MLNFLPVIEIELFDSKKPTQKFYSSIPLISYASWGADEKLLKIKEMTFSLSKYPQFKPTIIDFESND